MRMSALLLLILIIIGLNIDDISADAINKPSVPDFSLKLFHYVSDDPAVYAIDPYTGENVTITPAKHQESTEIHIIIRNQPFTPYKDSSGNLFGLYYDVRSKGHFSDGWGEGVIISIDKDNASYTVTTHSANYYPANAQIDFQVKAMIGYFKDTGFPSEYHMAPVFQGESSDWSATQTITVTNSSSTTSDTSPVPSSITPNPSDLPQSPTATPLQPDVGSSVLFGLDWVGVAIIALLAVVVALLLVVVVVFLRRRSVGLL